MRRASTIFVSSYLGTGIVLVAGGTLLPPRAAGIARAALFFYLVGSITVFIFAEFFGGLRQGLSEFNLATKPPPTPSTPNPSPPSPASPAYAGWLEFSSGAACIMAVVLALTADRKTAPAWFEIAAALGLLLALLRFIQSAVQGYGQSLRQHRAATGCCLHCGYDLRGSPTGQCPECGEDRIPRPGRARSK